MSFWQILLPEAAINLLRNPGAEGSGLVSYAAAGSNTVEQSSEQKHRGIYSVKATYQNNLSLIVTSFTLIASTTYHKQCWVYVPADWDGGDIRLDATAYTGAVITYNHIYDHGVSPTGEWVYLESKFAFDTDVTGEIGVRATSAPTAGRFIYADSFQFEVNADHATSYFDGDFPGCHWNGLEYSSTSTRPAQERSGGEVVDLADYGLNIQEIGGFGMAPQIHSFQANAFLDGAILEHSKTGIRSLLLTGDVEGASYEAYHSKRKDIINLVKASAVSKKNGKPQPFILRYTGANTNKPVQIACYYDDGLGLTGPRVFSEIVAMRLLAADPFWYELAGGGAILTTSVSETHRYLSRLVEGNWENFGPSSGSGAINAIVVTSDYIYVGGNFTNFDGIANADYIARYDKLAGTWGAMGTGMDNVVECMTLAPDGVSLYVGGQFTSAGGVANTDGIARWTGAGWQALGTGVSGGSGIVNDVVFDQLGNLYATGDFTTMGGVADTAYIAMWNGSVWTALSTGLGGIGRALAVDQANNLFIGGDFTNLGDANGDYIVKWNGTAFSSLSTGANDLVRAIAVGIDNSLYIGGDFTTAGGVSAGGVAKWNGTTYKALGSGVSGGDVFYMDFIDGILYVSGTFTAAGGITMDRIAIWNGSSWAHLDIDFTGTPTINVAVKDPYTGYLYVGYSTTGTTLTSVVNTISNPGTARCYPRITIKRSGGTSATVAYLKNQTTGATLWLNYALLDGETLTLDFTPGARKIESSKFGIVWRAILRPSDFVEFGLQPGTNDIIAFVNPVGSPTITALATWPIMHESADGAAD